MAKILDPNDLNYVVALSQDFKFQGYIPDTDRRGITLNQLTRVVTYISRNCANWHDTAPAAYSKTSGQQLSMSFLNLYHVNGWVIMPSTKARNCAFVELLTGMDQTPEWFISHWWGEAIADFLSCVKRHTELREVEPDKAYWICAYANRQHSLAQEVVADPTQTSFFKALAHASGVVVILDRHGPATAFSRIWCMFEESVALMRGHERATRLLLDLATTSENGVHVLTDGLTKSDMRPLEPMAAKAEREQDFPIHVFRGGLKASVQDAEASVESDRVHILNCIVGRDIEAIPVLAEHPQYERLNARLRATFASTAYRLALANGLAEDLQLPNILKADHERYSLLLDFNNMLEMDDSALKALAQGLPGCLRQLKLSLSFCPRLGRDGVDGVPALTEHLPIDSLCDLSLNFGGLRLVSKKDLGALFGKLLSANLLTSLELVFESCIQMDDALFSVLGGCFPPILETLVLDLKCTEISDAGIAAIAVGLPPTLSSLTLQLTSCKQLGDAGLGALRVALPKKLSRLRVFAGGTKVSAEKMKLCRDIDAFRRWSPSAEEAAAPALPGILEAPGRPAFASPAPFPTEPRAAKEKGAAPTPALQAKVVPAVVPAHLPMGPLENGPPAAEERDDQWSDESSEPEEAGLQGKVEDIFIYGFLKAGGKDFLDKEGFQAAAKHTFPGDEPAHWEEIFDAAAGEDGKLTRAKVQAWIATLPVDA